MLCDYVQNKSEVLNSDYSFSEDYFADQEKIFIPKVSYSINNEYYSPFIVLCRDLYECKSFLLAKDLLKDYDTDFLDIVSKRISHRFSSLARNFIENPVSLTYNNTIISMNTKLKKAIHISTIYLFRKYLSDINYANDILYILYYIILFSGPYREDWQECSNEEVENDLEYAKNIYHRQYISYPCIPDLLQRYPYSEKREYTTKELYIISNYNNLLKVAYENEDVEIDKNEFTYTPCLPFYNKQIQIPELPTYINAICVNKKLNVYIPTYLCYDDFGIKCYIVPTTKKVWNSLLKVYDIPSSNNLYALSTEESILSNPQSSIFENVMQKNGYIFDGKIDIRNYLGMKIDDNNPDYVFYKFYSKFFED